MRGISIFPFPACNPDLFTRLTQSKCAKYIKTLREVNVAFLPYERQVSASAIARVSSSRLLFQAFTLDSPDTFFISYDPSQSHLRTPHLDVIAEQIATLCATLGEYPAIRYRCDNEKMLEFAHAVQQKLNQYKADDATMGEVSRFRLRRRSSHLESRLGRRQSQICASPSRSRFRCCFAPTSRIDIPGDGARSSQNRK